MITVNLGTGRPSSVLEMVTAFEKASGKRIPYQVVARRAGDLAEYYAEPALAREVLHWRAQHDIDRMCLDTWRWQTTNPSGLGKQLTATSLTVSDEDDTMNAIPLATNDQSCA
jgi:UDP-glucose 4-epimerase